MRDGVDLRAWRRPGLRHGYPLSGAIGCLRLRGGDRVVGWRAADGRAVRFAVPELVRPSVRRAGVA